MTRFCAVFGAGLAVVVSLAASSIVGLYTDSPTIHGVATQYLWLVSWSWGAYGLVMSVNASFNGSGRPLPGVVISSCRVLFVLLPLIALGQWLFGLSGLFGAIALSNLGVGIVAWYWLGSHIHQLEHRHGAADATHRRSGAPDQKDIRKDAALPP